MWLSGANVFAAYKGLFQGMLGSKKALSDTFVAAAPYILTGLSVALGFQCGLFNIGAEGQFYMGALFSVVTAYSLTGLPGYIHLPLSISAGVAGGAAWGAIPGWLKARFGAHEVINTIMMNYIGIKCVDYFVKNVIRDPNASVDRTPYIQKSAELARIFGADYRFHVGVLIAIAAAFFIYVFLYKTRPGFEIRTTGANPGAAKYAGMNVSWNTVFVMAIAGGLAGLAGAGEVLGLKHNLPAAFSSGYGYDAIAVAFLARSSPLGVLPAAFLWGGLRNGAGLMQLRTGVSIDLINVIQALVIVFIAADPIVRWLYRLPKKRKAAAIFSRGWGN
ncbi:MAG: ABC transporter permease [Desulfobacterales bacterium]|nr:ABC transporter permease [Desulfobacterales bacterium]